MERSDAASACSAPFVVLKGLQVFINVLNLSLTAAIAGGFSKQHRESDMVFKELKISVNKSKSECRKQSKKAVGSAVKRSCRL